MKALLLEREEFTDDVLARLKQVVEIDFLADTDQSGLYQRLQQHQYDVIFARLGLMLDERAFRYQTSLKYVVSPTTGLNHIDVNAAEKLGIKVVSLKGESAFLSGVKSTAEHTWGLLLSLIRNMHAAFTDVRGGHWQRKPFLADELNTKTLGIIGFGRLGRIVADYGNVFGMTVLVNDVEPAQYQGVTHVRPVPLSELLKSSDVVVLLISWTPENERFMDGGKFATMKQGAYFINTSRGENVDEAALLGALKSGKLAGAALDVLHNDSSWNVDAPAGNPLLSYSKLHDNLLITPHMGGYGRTSIASTRKFVVDKFISLTNSRENK